MSIAQIVTRGLGTYGSIAAIITAGFIENPTSADEMTVIVAMDAATSVGVSTGSESSTTVIMDGGESDLAGEISVAEMVVAVNMDTTTSVGVSTIAEMVIDLIADAATSVGVSTGSESSTTVVMDGGESDLAGDIPNLDVVVTMNYATSVGVSSGIEGNTVVVMDIAVSSIPSGFPTINPLKIALTTIYKHSLTTAR